MFLQHAQNCYSKGYHETLIDAERAIRKLSLFASYLLQQLGTIDLNINIIMGSGVTTVLFKNL